MPSLFEKLRRKICSRLFIELSGRVEDTVLLAGVGRCGSTWLSEVINYNNNYRYIFEPFRVERVPDAQVFPRRPYVRPRNKQEEMLEAARKILSGRVRNPWTDSLNQRILCRKRIVKTIRANLILRWVREHFPQVPIVLLFRHPCAVANSRLKLDWPSPIEDFLSQPRLMADHLEPFRDLMERTTDPFERHVLMWCIQYYVPLRQFEPGQIHLAFYEPLCQNPEKHLRRLFEYLDKPFEEKVLARAARPSAMARRRSAIHSGGDLIRRWKKNVSDHQAARAVEIMQQFGLDRIYSVGALPNRDAAHELLRVWPQ